jgi:serine/threonine protein kinase
MTKEERERVARKSGKTDYYELLEVSPRARKEVIKAAFKTLMGTYHPDHHMTDRVAKSLNEAHGVLTNDKSRAKYDKERNNVKGTIIGDYKVIKLIAEGGFGKTYLGEQMLVGEKVCIKHALSVSPQDEEILVEETKAVWDLRHYAIPAMRNIVKLDDGSLALIMSYVPGPTLEQIVDDGDDRMDPETVCWITQRVLNVLMYLHYNGVIHGDVKPQNIIVQPDSHMVVLVDYGLSLIRPSRNSSSKGYTPFFAPPEQIKGFTLLPGSDMYALGMTMIYALGGDVKKKEVPSSVPEPVCEFIKRLIAYDILARPDWEKENLLETLQEIRVESFGRDCSFGKAIPGFKKGK